MNELIFELNLHTALWTTLFLVDTRWWLYSLCPLPLCVSHGE